MPFAFLFRSLGWVTPRGRAKPRPAARARFVPRLLPLEDRTLPSTFNVLNLADRGPGSLRQAITDANAAPGADEIQFQGRLKGTIRLTRGQLKITDDVTIQGTGKVAVSGNNTSRVFSVAADTAASISLLTITRGLANGDAPDLAGAGGGILNRGDLTLTDVTLYSNRAVGDADVSVPVSAAFQLVGGATGGAVANFGTLTVTGSTFRDNRALGASTADSSATSFPGPSFAGTALGGGVGNFGVASVTDSRFIDNVARAGSRGKGDFAGIGSGGAILNDSALTVSGSSFSRNQAIAGDASTSPFHNGHALGGAITSGTLLPAVGQAVTANLVVNTSEFDRNQALGGDNNTVTLPPASVPPADAPNNAYGGAILVYQGSGTISSSMVTRNQAVGGVGGADRGGSLGVGGGIFFFNFIGGVQGTVEDSVVSGNEAVGGAGRVGIDGGDAYGGGIATGGLGSPFAAPGAVTLRSTLVTSNRARGGDSGRGADGGDAYGGGVYNGTDTSLSVSRGFITLNEAVGGKRGKGGRDGDGIGGGVYNTGPNTKDATVEIFNRTSTQTFKITSEGNAPGGLPVFPGGEGPHAVTSGDATYLGQHTGAGTFQLLSLDLATLRGTFQSGTPFVFTGANGDKLAFNYGRTDAGAAQPGKFTLYPQPDGKVVAVFIAEFTPDPAASTGRFENVTGGSFIMVATSEPFSPVPNAEGFTEGFTYSWSGEGTLEFGSGTP